MSPCFACSPTYIKQLWQSGTSSHFWCLPNLCDRTLCEKGRWHIYTSVGCEWDSHYHKPLTKAPTSHLISMPCLCDGSCYECVCMCVCVRADIQGPGQVTNTESSKFGVGDTLMMRVNGYYRALASEITTPWLYGCATSTALRPQCHLSQTKVEE